MKKARSKSYLTGPKLAGIVDLLECTAQTISFSDLLEKSKIQFKKSFLVYLKFCVKKNLISHYRTHGTRSQNRDSRQVWYVLSPRGKLFLRLMK